MVQKRQRESPRLILSAGTCIVIGVLLSLVFANIRIGLVVGLVLGVLGGSLFKRSRKKG
ncbi:MAG TPA: hypothetical protein VFX43_18945 [Chitinophagaceae bacterium]|nr:hypothetical protein [Chitinophagaceae bacterium]